LGGGSGEVPAIHAVRKLNINVIEALWGESSKLSDEILRRVYIELSNASEVKTGAGVDLST
jgi:hypothetical protein